MTRVASPTSWVSVALFFAVAVVSQARAQDAQAPPATRAEALQQQRQAKAAAAQPPSKPGFTTRLWDFIESSYGPQATQYNGITPRVGSVTSGGGFALGARYRNTLLFDRRAALRVNVMGSTKRYYRMGAEFEARRIGGTPLFVAADIEQYEFPQEDFFGLGADSEQADRTNFLLRNFRTGARTGVTLFDAITIGAGLALERPAVGDGRDSAYPTVDERFTDADAPGLSTQPTFLMTRAFVDLDRVGDPEHPRTGGRLQITFTNASDRDTGAYSFRQLDVDARQYFPFFQGKRVFVVRGLLTTTDTDAGRDVPFYMQPFLGGRRTLRGYDDQRFRGPHLLLLQAEYRFEVWPALDMAVFYDAGEVEARRQDLDLSGLKTDYGVSFRFGGENALFRFDVAFGGETRRYSVAFGDVF